ncbi:MAG: hypothetical protein AB1898_27230, partial [Acidobacteriota bacterium]
VRSCLRVGASGALYQPRPRGGALQMACGGLPKEWSMSIKRMQQTAPRAAADAERWPADFLRRKSLT